MSVMTDEQAADKAKWWEEQTRRYKEETVEVSKRCDRLDYDHKKLKAEHEALRREADEVVQSLTAARDQAAALHEALETLKAEHGKLLKDHDDARKRIKKLEKASS